MDASSLEELVFDPAKCSKLSVEQKRQLVYEVSRWSDSAADILHAWSRQEILQVLCFELGKERKYTGFTKSKIIEQLLKIIQDKQSEERAMSEAHMSVESCLRTPKRQRKSDRPSDFSAVSQGDSITITPNGSDSGGTTLYCKNSACKAKTSPEDMFCRRCSCCICHRYDDNKDPSLWLICNADPPFHGRPCGMSCHLECALRHEKSGISKDRQDKGLDGSFCCVSCGKVNDLLGSWRKQIVEARDTRRVDILCYRLSLCQKILAGTKRYQSLSAIVDEAVKKLEEEVGPLTGLPVKMARGIVNRLSSGPEIQRMCASAVKSLDHMLLKRVSDIPSDCKPLASKPIRLEDISASSVTLVLNSEDNHLGSNVSYSLWHRKVENPHYPPECTCRLFPPISKYLLSGLTPNTEFCLKVVVMLADDTEIGSFEYQFRTQSSQDNVERSQSPATNCSTLSNPSSVEDESNNIALPCSAEDGKKTSLDQRRKEANEDVLSLSNNAATLANKESSSNGQMVEEASTVNGSDTPPRVPCTDSLEANLLINPRSMLADSREVCRKGYRRRVSKKGTDAALDRRGDKEPQRIGSSSKKEEASNNNVVEDKDLECCIKVIRKLERDGHIDDAFRQKFLTWYGLRATAQGIRVVKVFMEAFSEDAESLADQLVDTFSDAVSSNKRSCTVPSGFCTKLWH